MPLSKRITNLHINQSSSPMQSDNDISDYNMNGNNHHHQQHQQQQQQQHHQFQNPNQFGPFGQMTQVPNGESNQFSEFSNLSHPIDEEREYRQYLRECNNASSSSGSSCTNNGRSNENHMATYDPYEPELNQEQNPFYYSKNKLLYDLYLERLRRHQWSVDTCLVWYYNSQ